ncbi:MAG: DUF488 domain-containing protein [Candidatus Eisenbacteria bacterium]
MSAPPSTLWTLGHSNRAWAELFALLEAHAIACVADVRRFPRSRRHPHFSRESLALALPAAGVRYEHRPGLGGMREPDGRSTNAGLRPGPFRGYADYMQTAEFAGQIGALLALAREGCTAMICAEAAPDECHRSLIADALTARGLVVEHILGAGETRRHTLTRGARVEGTRVTYPATQTTLGIEPD